VESLGSIGSEAGKAVESLARLAAEGEGELREDALLAMGRIAVEPEIALPVLRASLDDGSAGVRRAAAEALGRYEDRARDAAPRLFELLNDKEVRTEALEALKRTRARSIPHLVEALSNEEPSVRLFACETLGRMGPEARDIIPELRKVLEDDYDFIRRAARNAIRRIERDDS
jgi:HEAT repeat protein